MLKFVCKEYLRDTHHRSPVDALDRRCEAPHAPVDDANLLQRLSGKVNPGTPGIHATAIERRGSVVALGFRKTRPNLLLETAVNEDFLFPRNCESG